jgi:hypothetical protein
MTEPKGRAKGGIARAEALTPEQRSQIAKQAAAARWGEKPLRATHRGNFKDEFGIDVECYVLDDEQKTAVISQRGMGAALGLGQTGGNRLPRFLEGDKIAPYVGPELARKIANPLVFQWLPAAPNSPPPGTFHGYDVTILIDVCKAIIQAHTDGKLLKRQGHIVAQAQIILNASAKAGIKNLVYALAGYDATRAEVIAAFKFYVREEAREYEKEFPDQLYVEWYRLYQLPKPERGGPWKFKDLTLDHVYVPLARSNGKILALTRAQKAASEDRHAKLHQFLSEIGVKALRTHLGQLLGIAQVSNDRDQYERHVEKVFGVQLSLDFAVRGGSTA